MPETIECACRSDIGLRRLKNEDAVAAIRLENGALLMVADGIGGHRKGEVASDQALSIIQEKVMHYARELNLSRAKKLIKSAIKLANSEINELSTKPEYLDMGSTLVVALMLPEATLVCNIGDSRLYTFSRSGGLEQRTVDQTYVEYMVQSGKMTPEEARVSPKRNVLLNALGINPSIYYDELVLKNDYDALLLCSDGLYNMVDDHEIALVMGSVDTAENKVKSLIKAANAHGGLDNIGVSIMEVKR